jgi:chromosome segregation ATPase
MEHILFKKYFDQKYDQLNFLKDLKLFDIDNKIMDINFKLDSLNKKNGNLESSNDLDKKQEPLFESKLNEIEQCNKRLNHELNEKINQITTNVDDLKKSAEKSYQKYKVLKERINDLTKNVNLFNISHQELETHNKKLQQELNVQKEQLSNLVNQNGTFKQDLIENLNNQIIELNKRVLKSQDFHSTLNLHETKKRKMSNNQMVTE